jgi:hypothetical protein
LHLLLILALIYSIRDYKSMSQDSSVSKVTWLWAEFHFRRQWSFLLTTITSNSRHNSVGIAPGYGLDDRGTRVRFLAGAGNFSLHYRV